MSSRHRHPRNLEWRVIAVDAATPLMHAAQLQQALTELTEQGFSIMSTMPRGDALIITASRMNEPPRQEEPPPSPTGNGKLSN